MAGRGKSESVHAKQKVAKCMVVGDLKLRSVRAEHTDMMVECFQGIKTEQLHMVMQNGHLGSPESVIIHMDTNDLRSTRNLDFSGGELFALLAIKEVIPNCRLVLSGVLRRRDVSWQLIGAINDRFVC